MVRFRLQLDNNGYTVETGDKMYLETGMVKQFLDALWLREFLNRQRQIMLKLVTHINK